MFYSTLSDSYIGSDILLKWFFKQLQTVFHADAKHMRNYRLIFYSYIFYSSMLKCILRLIKEEKKQKSNVELSEIKLQDKKN
jgi:hypothetical protein